MFALATLLPWLLAASMSNHSAPVFDGRFARDLDLILSSDSLEGRKTGQPGGRRAEEFAASRFREWGLRPGIGDTSYFQPYRFLSSQVTGTPELTFTDSPVGALTYIYSSDYVVLLYSGSGSVTAEAVFVGYGITAPDKARDDYAGVDVAGKVVIALRGAPRDGKTWLDERAMGYKTRVAQRHGARGILICENEAPILGTIQERFFEEDMPALGVSARVVRDLLIGTGHSFDALKTEAGLGRNVSFGTGRTVKLAVSSEIQREARGRNVVARIPGSDAALKKECVIVGAHLDHLGRDAAGHIYPGADDNGSGAATVLAMARELARSGWQPRRTVYLALFTCEEQGLQGSTWLAEHPPAESVAVMLNMDMVGVGNPVPNMGGVDRYPELVRMARALVPDSVRSRVEVGGSGPDSDHWPFSERGIPSLFTVSAGSHPNYHQVEDKGWRLQSEVLDALGKFELRVLEAVADTSAFRVDAHRMARLAARMARPVARARFDERRRGLHEAATRGAGVILLEMPPAEPLLMSDRLSRMEKDFAVDSSLFRLARSAAELEDHAQHGKVSVILEAQVGAFDLQDSLLISYLKQQGIRAILPDAAPNAAEARFIGVSGLLLDQTQLRSPLASEQPSLYSGRIPPGAGRGFEFSASAEGRGEAARSGYLLGEDPVKVAARLFQKKWTRESVINWMGLNFARFWKDNS